jgi:hypothetical protein
MSIIWRSVLSSLAIVAAIAVWVAWLASGRETFTKSGKALEVGVRNELFGDVDLQVQLQRGPIFGYYIGLDLAVAVTVAALIILGIVWLSSRRARRRRAAPVERGSPP